MRIRFFVTGHGRSGTAWLARLLDRCDDTVAVHHEPLAQFDRRCYATGQMDWDGRKQRMADIAANTDRDYAEVNSYLRYVVPELRVEFGVPVGAIIRDGRYVVRSMLARGLFVKPGYPKVQPPDDLETPFEKCCWYWANSYRDFDAPVWRLEDLNADYEALVELCEFLGIRPDRTAWKIYVGQRVNAHVNDPAPPAWGAAQWADFKRLAGDVYERYYASEPIEA